MLDIDKLEQAALAANANGDVTLQIHPSAVLELINRLRTAEKQRDTLIELTTSDQLELYDLKQKLEAAENDAAVGNWLCNYMASETIEHDDYLVAACYENNPEKFKLAVIAAMKEKP